MSSRAVITVMRPREEVERLWRDPAHRSGRAPEDAAPRFLDAPGDRGTEIHLEADGSADRAKAMDELRRFKQLVETGEIARSDGAPEGELAERKAGQRPAQPLEADELQKAGA